MKVRLIAGILLAAMTISACDDDTQGIGDSLTSNVDRFQILTDTFTVSTRSIVADSVLARSQYCYLGRIKDPETGTYVTSDFTTQFMMLETMATEMFPTEDQILSLEDGKVVADSCFLNIYINSYIGDTLAPMKVTAYELLKPIEEGQSYYTDYDPIAEGHVRTDGIKKGKAYTYTNYLVSDSLRSLSSYMPTISIPLNDEYTDTQGNTYKNYGTYLMRTYYEHPEYYKNAYSFIHHVCPGFFFKTTDGVGLMSEIYMTELVTYYKFTDADTVYVGTQILSGTEEVMQTTKITNDQNRISELAEDNTCTYLKTPAGLFTEVTLPVEDIVRGHESDTISSAKIVFTRLNNVVADDDDALSAPSHLLMIPKDSLYSFFENKNLPDYKTSFISAFSDSYNTYTFDNISTMITYMYNHRDSGSEDWNKVVLIPVERSVQTINSSVVYTKVSNLMSLTSTRLVGGSENPQDPIKISIIYNKFK